MPIYAYKCGSCGHAKDVLQKISDDPLTVCPSCGAPSFTKQITAAGFQLKGSGWYATDFKGGGSPAPAADKAADAKPAESGKSDKSDGAPSTGPAPGKGDSAPSTGPAPGKGDSKPAPAKSDAPGASAGGCGASCASH